MTDLRDYKVQPDEGLFEKVQRRLRLRRLARMAAVVASVAVVGGAAWLALSHNAAAEQIQQTEASGTAVAATTVGSTVAPMGEEIVDNAQRPVVAVGVAKPADSVSDVAGMALMEDDNSDQSPVIDGQLLVANGQSMGEAVTGMSGEKAVSRAETAVDMEEQPAGTLSTGNEEKATDSPKVGHQNPHYDNIIWAPNIVVPNGEVEENRLFQIQSTSSITDFRLHIFNRRGMRVYTTVDPSFKWDASQMPQGAYVWVATFRDSDGLPRREQGSVVVVR